MTMSALVADTWKTLPELFQALGTDLPGGVRALQQAGLITAAATPSPASKKQELARWMTRRGEATQFLWNEDRVRSALEAKQVTPTPLGVRMCPTVDPRHWGSMAKLGKPLSLDARQTGLRLKQAGWRDDLGHPTDRSIRAELACAKLLDNGRLTYNWHLDRTRLALEAADFTAQDRAIKQGFALAQTLRRAMWALDHVHSPIALTHQLAQAYVAPQQARLMAMPKVERVFTVGALLQWLNAPTDRPAQRALDSFLSTGHLWGVASGDLALLEHASPSG